MNINLATPLQKIKPKDQYAAVAALAASTAKQLGGSLIAANFAAAKSMEMLADGFTAASAIEISAKMAIRRFNKVIPWKGMLA